jgi:hypothetical protein
VHYLRFLRGVHAALRPPTYLEVGVRHGDSLALSRARSVGIDPAFEVRAELACPVSLFRTTSDEYFARPQPLAPLGGDRVALSFIDGMHLLEYVLRDFIAVERLSEWWTVVVFDDILPRTVDEAARERHTRQWTGDVFKIAAILERERRDLVLLRVGTQPTGLLLVLVPDPSSDVLARREAALVEEWVKPDPQVVEQDVFDRVGVLDPQAVLDAPFWRILRDGRDAGTVRDEGVRALRASVSESLGVGGGRIAAGRGLLGQAGGLLRGRR